jgi:hypothetical protein
MMMRKIGGEKTKKDIEGIGFAHATCERAFH